MVRVGAGVGVNAPAPAPKSSPLATWELMHRKQIEFLNKAASIDHPGSKQVI